MSAQQIAHAAYEAQLKGFNEVRNDYLDLLAIEMFHRPVKIIIRAANSFAYIINHDEHPLVIPA